MSFVGVIDSERHKIVWSKAILSLASISEHIKFVMSAESLSLSAVNNAKTSHAEIVFKKSFFYEYSVDFTEVLPEGFENNETGISGVSELDNTASSYSFVINSKHLAILFKNIDTGDLEYICFRINWSRKAPEMIKYKLLIETKTKKLIIKKYQTSYQPVLKNQLNVSSMYKQELYDQQQKKDDMHEESNSINYIMIEQIIPKQFLDMIPSSTEDFRLEIKNEKILFSGYTKQVLKEREYLKQQMSVTVTLNLDELINTNLITEVDQEPLRKAINFRLKDFKNFMNLVTSIGMSTGTELHNDEYSNLNNMISMSNEDYFEIFFKNPGDPILFELRNNPHVLIQYVQITCDDDDDAGTNASNTKINPESLRKHHDRAVLPSNIIQKVPVGMNIDSNKTKTNIQSTKNITKPNGPLKPNRPPEKNIHTNQLFVPESESQTQAFDYSSNYENDEVVTYGDQRSPAQGGLYKRQNINESTDIGMPNIDMDMMHSVIGAEDSNKSKKRKIIDEDTDYESEEKETETLGPTQIAYRPKSIFD